jgi:DNA invertase Pin-like site-specific DNA recombinase
MALTGYGRVSTRDQNPDSQRDALLEAGVAPERIYIDHGRSGKLASRPELDRCLASLQEGDTLVITRLSRAARSLRNLLVLTEDLRERGVGLRVLKQDIDTTTATGRLVFHILAALDEFERELIVENTKEGVEAAKARGRHGGRPAGLDPRRVKHARQLYNSGETVAEIAKVMRVSRATVYRHLEASKSEGDPARRR